MAQPLEWDSLGESQRFRKLPLYPLSWNIPSEDFHRGLVLPSPCAGPMCVLGSDPQNKLQVALYSQTGTLISKLVPDIFQSAKERLVRGGAGWTGESDILVLVTASGMITAIEGSSLRQASMNLDINSKSTKSMEERRLVLASVAKDHIVAILSDGSVLCVRHVSQLFSNYSDTPRYPRCDRISPPILKPKPYEGFYSITDVSSSTDSVSLSSDFYCVLSLCFSVNTYNDEIIALSSHGDGRLVRVDFANEKQTLVLTSENFGPFYRTAASPSGKSWALCNKKGDLFFIADASFSLIEPLIVFDESFSNVPSQICFCGETENSSDDADGAPPTLACSYLSEGALLLVRKQDEWIKYDFTMATGFALAQEVDGVRIVTNTSHELLLPVPRCLVNILQFGSAASSAVLLDAIETADLRSPESIRALRAENQLWPAVKDLIYGALDEFDLDSQRRLLRVASKGKLYLSEMKERKSASKGFAKACQTLRALNVAREARIGLPLTLKQFDHCGGIVGLTLRLARWKFYFVAQRVLSECGLYVGEAKRHVVQDRIKLLWARDVLRSRWTTNPTLLMEQIERIDMKRGFHLVAKLAARTFSDSTLAIMLLDKEKNYRKRIARTMELEDSASLATQLSRENLDKEFESFVSSVLMVKSEDANKTVDANAWGPRYREEEMRINERIQKLSSTSVALTSAASLAEACRMLAYATGDDKEINKIRKEFQVSDLTLWVAKARAYISREEWEKVDKLAAEKPLRCGILIDACIQLGFKKESLRYVTKLTNVEEQMECFVRLQSYAKAIELLKSRAFSESREWGYALIRANILIDEHMSDNERESLLTLLSNS